MFSGFVRKLSCIDNPFQTLEACMKNCGGPIHDEVATRDFMDELRNLANVSALISLFSLGLLSALLPNMSHFPTFKYEGIYKYLIAGLGKF